MAHCVTQMPLPGGHLELTPRHERADVLHAQRPPDAPLSARPILPAHSRVELTKVLAPVRMAGLAL